jgi:two-component system, sensor histidine kinase and response regulator
VGNGREALLALEAAPFDVVLMDVQMPEMGGFEATAAIRVREAITGAHQPIVAMTAHAMKDDRERCLAAGMDEYLTKPIDAQQLYATIESIGSGVPALLAPASPVLTDAYQALLARVGGDMQLLADASRLFIEHLPAMLERVRAGLDAHDGPALQRAAHGLKAAAGNLEGRSLADAARRLENMGRAADFAGEADAWTMLTNEASLVVRVLTAYTGASHNDKGVTAAKTSVNA